MIFPTREPNKATGGGVTPVRGGRASREGEHRPSAAIVAAERTREREGFAGGALRRLTRGLVLIEHRGDRVSDLAQPSIPAVMTLISFVIPPTPGTPETTANAASLSS
jgi:hypothetical protein